MYTNFLITLYEYIKKYIFIIKIINKTISEFLVVPFLAKKNLTWYERNSIYYAYTRFLIKNKNKFISSKVDGFVDFIIYKQFLQHQNRNTICPYENWALTNPFI